MAVDSAGVVDWPLMCGDGVFWNYSYTINTTNPDLTTCFQDTVLTWFPCGFLFLGAIIYLPYLYKLPQQNRLTHISPLCRNKLIGLVTLIVITISELIYAGTHGTVDHSLAAVLRPAVFGATYMLAIFITIWEFKKGIHSAGLMFFFWLFITITDIIPFRSKIMHTKQESHVQDSFLFVTFYISFGVVFLEFILTFFADLKAIEQHPSKLDEHKALLDEPHEQPLFAGQSAGIIRNQCPELHAVFVSRMLFSHMTKFVINGYRKTIEYKNLWNIRPQDRCRILVTTFTDNWNNVVRRLRKTSTSRQTPSPTTSCSQQRPSLLGVLWRSFGGRFSLAATCRLSGDLLAFVGPFALNLLISFVESEDAYLWTGFIYVAILFLSTAIRSVILQHYHYNSMLCGLRVRTAMVAATYQKALRLSNSARRDCTVGEIVNLMSVDAQRLQDAPLFLQMAWSSPLTISIAIYFVWQLLGPAALAGVGVVVLVLSINMTLSKKLHSLQMKQMLLKDERIKLTSEVLNGIKVLKLYAWEDSFGRRIQAIRDKEISNLRAMSLIDAGMAASFLMTPYMMGLASFAVYVLSDPSNVLDANKAFVSLSLFNIMQLPMLLLPRLIQIGIMTNVALKRLCIFLNRDEFDPDSVSRNTAPGDAVTVKNGKFEWDESMVTLSNINLNLGAGKLIAIVGNVGAGKSSLLSAILGEMKIIDGTMNTQGSIAYVPQQAWIQNMTVRDNICFNHRYIESYYKRVLDACALTPDLKILPGGDMTEIGEKGINLSGGQKLRVSMARAVYSQRDLYLLDDPLSAVDSHVGKHMFDQVIGPNGLLNHTTRLFVTHSVTYLQETDLIILMKDGHITDTGTYNDLMENNEEFSELISSYQQDNSLDESDSDRAMSSDSALTSSSYGSTSSQRGRSSSMLSARKRRKRRTTSSSQVNDTDADKQAKDNTLIAEEYAQIGNVTRRIYSTYFEAYGMRILIAGCIGALLYAASDVMRSLWLTRWTDDPPPEFLPNSSVIDTSLRDLRLGVYGGIGIVLALCYYTVTTAVALGTVRSASLFHKRLNNSILHAPMAFFDTTPIGRILNRYSKDVDTLDTQLQMVFRSVMTKMIVLASIFCVISYSTPIFLVVFVPLCGIYLYMQRCYITTSRQLKRLDMIHRSPIYANFSETLSGVTSIRAYGQQDRFNEHCYKLLDNNNIAYYPLICCDRWIGINLEMIGNFIVLFAGVFAVISRESLSPSMVGLSVSYAMQVTLQMNNMIRHLCDLETNIVSAERISEYIKCSQEAPLSVPGNEPPHDWPQKGHIVFTDYTTQYRPGLDIVLDKINCDIQPGEKIGVVGRTGAGKSSLTMALFRIIESVSGTIHIDDINIAKIGLHDLRSKLTIIPQDPVLFSATLRVNLDPFDAYSDDSLWTALEHAHLKKYFIQMSDGLEYQITEGGDNLSIGQRQLLCLARALLRHTRVLILDEATAAVDLETDDLVQATIRDEFAGNCTVITVAHRINTILDYDRVMVLDKGSIVEFKHPDALLQDKKSLFYSLAKDAKLV